MIQINISGFKIQEVEFNSQTAALLFLTDLREEHSTFIKSLIDPMSVGNNGDFIAYRSMLRHASKEYPLKVEIIDMTGLI